MYIIHVWKLLAIDVYFSTIWTVKNHAATILSEIQFLTILLVWVPRYRVRLCSFVKSATDPGSLFGQLNWRLCTRVRRVQEVRGWNKQLQHVREGVQSYYHTTPHAESTVIIKSNSLICRYIVITYKKVDVSLTPRYNNILIYIIVYITSWRCMWSRMVTRKDRT